MPGYDGRGTRFPLTIVRGADLSIELTVLSGGAPVNLSAATIAAEIYPSGSTTPAVTMTDVVSGGSSNVIALSLTEVQTAALTATRYSWTLWVTRSGDERPWLAGQVNMTDGTTGQAGTSGPYTLTVDGNLTVTVNVSGWPGYEALDTRYARVVNVAGYGAVGDGTTDDHDAIEAAIAAIGDEGGVLWFPGGLNYETSGGHVLPDGTTIAADGAVITHTGNNTCFDFNSSGAFRFHHRSGIRGVQLVGNSGAAAVGVEIGNMWGFFVENCSIRDYTAGIGFYLHNSTNWTEGTTINSMRLVDNAVGMRFHREPAAYFSFGYTYIHALSVNVPANGVGIDIGGESASTVYLYNSTIQANIWPEGNNAICVKYGAESVMDHTRLHVVGEVPNEAVYTGVKGLYNLGGDLFAYGEFHIKNGPDDLALGRTRIVAQYDIVDSMSGTDGVRTYKQIATTNPEVSHNAGFGFISGTNIDSPYVQMYADNNNDFRVIKVPFDGNAGEDGTVLMKMRATGDLELPVADTGLRMKSPDGTVYRITLYNGGGWNVVAV
jgi:hypothetical protein